MVANVGEGDDLPPALAARGAIAVCARDEAELAELEPEEAAAMRAELGLEQGALEALVRAAYGLLGLVTFFTAVGGNEVRARSLRQRQHGLDAAGSVHTDMQRGLRARRGDRLGGAASRPARSPPPASAAGCGPRAATTSSPTARC